MIYIASVVCPLVEIENEEYLCHHFDPVIKRNLPEVCLGTRGRSHGERTASFSVL